MKTTKLPAKKAPVPDWRSVGPFSPPDPDVFWRMARPWRLWFRPAFFGLENVNPDRPHMYVCNHTIYGVLDAPLYMAKFYRDRGVYLRGLGDHFHFQVPFWRVLVTRFGAVHGTRENCARLMEMGENVLVFPGGGREVCKRRGENYKLLWKRRSGFARLAIQYGYDLIPMASVGPDNAYSILLDANDFTYSILGKLAGSMGLMKTVLRDGEAVPPVVRGIGPPMIPRPERFYISVGKAISSAPYAGRHDDKNAQMALRGKTENSINRMIREMLHYREQDARQPLWRRILRSL